MARGNSMSDAKRWGAIIVSGIVMIILVVTVSTAITSVDQKTIVVRQGVIDGKLTIWGLTPETAGMQMQWWGDLTTYKRSGQYKFEAKTNTDGKVDTTECYTIRFNDNGTAKLCGSVGYVLPKEKKSMGFLHTEFGSTEAIFNRIIRKAMEKSIYMSGSLMSSRESTNDRRAELLEHIRAQVLHGIYKVESDEQEVEDFFADPIIEWEDIQVPVEIKGVVQMDEATGKPIMKDSKRKTTRQPKKKIKVVIPVKAADGSIEIADPSMIEQYGLLVRNFSISKIVYDKRVMAQIEAQQKAMMSIQTSRAEAQRAEQDAITAKAQGDANVARTKAEQEVEKQKKMTQAETRLAVAQQDLLTATEAAKSIRVTADAEAYRKKQAIIADGALDKKLAALIAINKAWAASAAKQPLVPSIQMGGSGNGGAPGIQNWMEILGAKAAKDLAVDMDIK